MIINGNTKVSLHFEEMHGKICILFYFFIIISLLSFLFIELCGYKDVCVGRDMGNDEELKLRNEAAFFKFSEKTV
jgi:hypothetical protein